MVALISCVRKKNKGNQYSNVGTCTTGLHHISAKCALHFFENVIKYDLPTCGFLHRQREGRTFLAVSAWLWASKKIKSTLNMRKVIMKPALHYIDKTSRGWIISCVSIFHFSQFCQVPRPSFPPNLPTWLHTSEKKNQWNYPVNVCLREYSFNQSAIRGLAVSWHI